jgi:O-antigen ligase
VQGVKESLSGFLYRPLIGRGLGAYDIATAISHNQYAQFLSEVGILGMGAFWWLIVSLVKLCWRGIKESMDNLHRGYFIGFLAGLIGWLVMNLGTTSFTSIRTMEFFRIMMAVLVASHSMVLKDVGTHEQVFET